MILNTIFWKIRQDAFKKIFWSNILHKWNCLTSSKPIIFLFVMKLNKLYLPCNYSIMEFYVWIILYKYRNMHINLILKINNNLSETLILNNIEQNVDCIHFRLKIRRYSLYRLQNTFSSYKYKTLYTKNNYLQIYKLVQWIQILYTETLK